MSDAGLTIDAADWTFRGLDAPPTDHAIDVLAELLLDLEEESHEQKEAAAEAAV